MGRAPDPTGGRKLAAAFTAVDALQMFVAAKERDAGQNEAISVRLNGMDLFSRLLQGDLDGIVFNPAGPTVPVALAREIAAAVTSLDNA